MYLECGRHEDKRDLEGERRSLGRDGIERRKIRSEIKREKGR